MQSAFFIQVFACRQLLTQMAKCYTLIDRDFHKLHVPFCSAFHSVFARIVVWLGKIQSTFRAVSLPDIEVAPRKCITRASGTKITFHLFSMHESKNQHPRHKT